MKTSEELLEDLRKLMRVNETTRTILGDIADVTTSLLLATSLEEKGDRHG